MFSFGSVFLVEEKWVSRVENEKETSLRRQMMKVVWDLLCAMSSLVIVLCCLVSDIS